LTLPHLETRHELVNRMTQIATALRLVGEGFACLANGRAQATPTYATWLHTDFKSAWPQSNTPDD